MSEPTPGQPSERQEPPHEPHRKAVERAQVDLEAGREWKARDRLAGLLADRYDAEALDLLGEVNYTMRDLPAAGAAWFATPRRGEEVDEAIAAWRERHSDHFAQMWRSLPRSVRDRPGNKRVDALRRRAEQADAANANSPAGTPGHARGPHAQGQAGGVDAAVVIAVVIAAALVVCTVVGFVTVVRWVVPG